MSRAKETTEKWTLAEWIEYQGLGPYSRENERYSIQLRALTAAKRDWPEEFLQLLAKFWYDYSCVGELETLREKYERAMRGAALLGDAVIKLYDGKERGRWT